VQQSEQVERRSPSRQFITGKNSKRAAPTQRMPLALNTIEVTVQLIWLMKVQTSYGRVLVKGFGSPIGVKRVIAGGEHLGSRPGLKLTSMRVPQLYRQGKFQSSFN
jgi:hypothetical protein